MQHVILAFLLFLTGTLAVSMYPVSPYEYSKTTNIPNPNLGSVYTLRTPFTVLGQTIPSYRVHASGGFFALGTLPVYINVFWSNGYLYNAPGEPATSGAFFGEYQGASPIDNLLQIQSTSYLKVSWTNVGYADAKIDRLNNFQAIVATDNTDTYACYIYPDDVSTGNPNGGIDWIVASGFSGLLPSVGIRTDYGYSYQIPDSRTIRLTGIDGVVGDGTAASLTGTHLPGQFCFVISGSEVVPLGPALITSPSNRRVFTPSTIRFVSFDAKALLVSKSYSIQVNGIFIRTVTSSRLARAAATLDLTSFPDGTLTISLVRDSDSATVSVEIIKDTATFVSIISPSSSAVADQFTSLVVSGRGEVGGNVVVKIEDSSASTPIIVSVSGSIVVDANGNWASVPLDLSSQAEGTIRITATITDAVENIFTSNTVTIIKDTSVSIAINAPINYAFIVSSSRARSLTVSGFADVGSRIVVKINDANQQTPTVASASQQVSPIGTWSTTLDVSSLSDGLLSIVAVVTDGAGNIASSETVNLNKQTSISGFAITSPSSGSSVTSQQAKTLAISGTGQVGGRISLVVTGTDNAGNSSGRINRTAFVNNVGAWSSTVNVSTLPGIITISGTAYDAASNSGAVSPVSFTITR